LTERRATITRTWRPAGAPARRLDDFDQVEAEPATVRTLPCRQQPELIEERRSIGRRLENWGMWANMDAHSRSRAACMTAAICDSMRRHAAGVIGPAAPVNDRLDVPDAERINAGMAGIAQEHRNVLQWTYVVCAKPWAVAGACGFPSCEYDDRLRAAQETIEAAVGARKQHA
jgi:hypothetical protein